MVEGMVVHESRQLVHIGLGLAREPDDEGGPQRDARDPASDALQQTVVVLARTGPLHPFQDGI